MPMVRAALREAVAARDLETICEYAATRRRALSELYAMTYHRDPLVVWRAVEAIGIAADVKSRIDMERVRDFIRRCIWMMNDESGGIGWHSPEVIGEVLFRVPMLLGEYGALLFHYFDESPFERGAVAAIARIAPLASGMVKSHLPKVEAMLRSSDAVRRAFAVKIFETLGVDLPIAVKEKLMLDNAQIVLYSFDSGTLQLHTIRDLPDAVS